MERSYRIDGLNVGQWQRYGDAESEYLDLLPDENSAMSVTVGVSVTCRLAFCSDAGRKAPILRTVPVRNEQRKGDDLAS